MSEPNTKRQLRGAIKAANAGPQSSDVAPVNPDDEPSTSRQAQQEEEGLRLQSKPVNTIESGNTKTLPKQNIEYHVQKVENSDDSSNRLDEDCGWNPGELSDLDSKQINLFSTRSDDVSYWSGDDRVMPLDSIFLMAPIPKRESFCNALMRSLRDWTMRIFAGFGLTHQKASSAWYKHCWDTPGADYRGHTILDLCSINDVNDISGPQASSTLVGESSTTMTALQD
ncbi:uncharacterized protein LOC117581046 [Drosophila guanche]|uniref:Uncharacterized protein n=1 Tax=Drosophila guanche TaxID=7266 RepID=A0A3B0JY44_DROGU|nr:uncharacterized protein LOC117581046 [Drosophila guanche]SPP78679.1 Hypothetical predicted protein [Drosophila guanche]